MGVHVHLPGKDTDCLSAIFGGKKSEGGQAFFRFDLEEKKKHPAILNLPTNCKAFEEINKHNLRNLEQEKKGGGGWRTRRVSPDHHRNSGQSQAHTKDKLRENKTEKEE